MFDETSGKWIKIFKGYAVAMFWLYITVGAIMCLVAWSGELGFIDEGFFDGIICLAGGFILAYAQLVVNMLVIQLLNNIQIIREKVEAM